MKQEFGAGDELLARLAAEGSPEIAYELLSAIFAGYPIDRVRPLLKSPSQRVVEAAVWIASELGSGARPLLPEIFPLLSSASRKVKFGVIDCVLAAATSNDGEMIARTAALISDEDEAVRWKAFRFLMSISNEQSEAVRQHSNPPLDQFDAFDPPPTCASLPSDKASVAVVLATAARRGEQHVPFLREVQMERSGELEALAKEALDFISFTSRRRQRT